MVTEKYCPDCKKTKPADDFVRGPSRKDGLASYCRVCDNERHRKYFTTNKYKKYSREYGAKRYAKHREKDKARAKLRYAVTKGEVIKPEHCESCGNKRRLEGHHEDYSKPLVADWLCRPCHTHRHGRLKTLSLIEDSKGVYN